MLKTIALAVFYCALALPAFAAPAPAPAASPADSTAQLTATLNFQQGKITLPGGIATLELPPAFRYLNPADAARLLVEGWGNPPADMTLGMILPAGLDPLSNEGWGVVVTYDKDGHVKDDDADSIKYDELLSKMQKDTINNNTERQQLGYQPMWLMGWAEPPHYDKLTHKLYWAEELKTGTQPTHGLNYSVRVLGRRGVLVLNAVASMPQIGAIRGEMQKVAAFTKFTPGHRYSDFNSATDQLAEYGIAALVAGGGAAKLGLFGKLLGLLLAFKKLLVLAVAAVGTSLFRLFRGDKPVSLEN